MTSILYVGLGTTGGWRHADQTLAAAPRPQRRRRPRRVAAVRARRSPPPAGSPADHRARRGVRHSPGSAPARVAGAVRSRRLLEHRSPVPAAPLALAHRGLDGHARVRLPARSPQRRAALARAAGAAARPPRGRPAAALRRPVPDRVPGPAWPGDGPSGAGQGRGAAGVVARAVRPRLRGQRPQEGLDLAVSAWAASRTDARLKVTGIAPADARAFLADRAVAVPETVDFLGRIPPDEHRELSRRAQLYLRPPGARSTATPSSRRCWTARCW